MSTTGGSFTTGTELSLILTAPNGTQVQLDGRRDMFTYSDKSQLLTSTPSDNGGLVDHRNIPNGYTGSIRADKANGNFSAFYAFLDANYYAGGPQQFFNAAVNIRSPLPGGATEELLFTKVVFHSYKGGSFEKNSMVKPDVEFVAQERIVL